MVRAEVGVDDAWVAHHGVWRSLGDDLALRHHDHPVRDVAHHVHVVLHEEHGASFVPQRLHVLEERLLQGGVHSCHRLVQHHHLGLGHQGASHLEQLALPAGERAGEVLPLGIEQEARQQGVCPLGDVVLLGPPQEREHRAQQGLALLSRGAGAHVLHDGQPGQDLGELEGPHHAAPRHPVGRNALQAAAVERPLAVVGRVEAGEQVEERGLAGAVGADECGDHASLDLHVLDIDCGQAAEGAAYVVGHEDGVGLRTPGRAWGVGQGSAVGRGVDGDDLLHLHLVGLSGTLNGPLSGHREPAPFGLRRFPEVDRSSGASVPTP